MRKLRNLDKGLLGIRMIEECLLQEWIAPESTGIHVEEAEIVACLESLGIAPAHASHAARTGETVWQVLEFALALSWI